tara:strand:- start:1584 stop:2780 length:1197 start_codon:yes stop_codon:yes gene_type:complete
MMIDFTEIDGFASSVFHNMCRYREHLHMYPELSYEEYETSAFIKSTLKEIGIPDVESIGDTGVIVTVYGDNHNAHQKCIAFRADIDALPIQEKNEVTYKSRMDGIMHACGHDVHTSILLGLAEVLFRFRNKLKQPVKLIFQPGEEVNPGGANLIIDEGGLSNPKVSKMFALHVFPDLEFGHVGFREGLYMASSDELHLEIIGRGGHGALTEETINPIFMGAEFILDAQNYVNSNSLTNTPSVINFGRFEALGSTNVVPQLAKVKGTFRTMNEEWRELVKRELKAIAKRISFKYDGTLKLNISEGYPFLNNDPSLTKKVRSIALQRLGDEYVHDLDFRLTAEDFAFYSHLVPVCFFRLGTSNKSRGITHGVHQSRFDIDHNSLKTGLKLFYSIALLLDS